MPIKRYFSDKNFEKVKHDFRFLLKTIQGTYGEYDFAIRDDCFNLYYKGYSMGMIKPMKDKTYMVSIHWKFIKGTKADNSKYYKSKKESKKYWKFQLSSENLHPFFQKKHLNEFSSKARNEPSGEIGFEQAIITDNLHRTDIIIIDRQITDTELKGKRLDLLALKQVSGIKYQFLLLEIKLGNNNELKGKVAKQLESYVKHVEEHFKEYKECYERHFLQKIGLGLIKQPTEIEIVEPVIGEIIVGGYSGIANASIKKLEAAYPHLKIKKLYNAL